LIDHSVFPDLLVSSRSSACPSVTLL
jgi:hypothetical protein